MAEIVRIVESGKDPRITNLYEKIDKIVTEFSKENPITNVELIGILEYIKLQIFDNSYD